MKINKNHHVLDSFIKYCYAHPEQRFWQALRNWAKVNFIYISKQPRCAELDYPKKVLLEDTFYWKRKNK